MIRKKMLAACAVATGLSLLPGCMTHRLAEREKMNVLFILLDDLGKEWIGCYGAKDIQTPNIDALAEMGTREDTLIILTADNRTCPQMVGHISERSIRGGKDQTTEPGVNIPFIVNWPGVIPEGGVSQELTDFTDIIPTLCELTGQPVPGKDKVDGISKPIMDSVVVSGE